MNPTADHIFRFDAGYSLLRGGWAYFQEDAKLLSSVSIRYVDNQRLDKDGQFIPLISIINAILKTSLLLDKTYQYIDAHVDFDEDDCFKREKWKFIATIGTIALTAMAILIIVD